MKDLLFFMSTSFKYVCINKSETGNRSHQIFQFLCKLTNVKITTFQESKDPLISKVNTTPRIICFHCQSFLEDILNACSYELKRDMLNYVCLLEGKDVCDLRVYTALSLEMNNGFIILVLAANARNNKKSRHISMLRTSSDIGSFIGMPTIW